VGFADALAEGVVAVAGDLSCCGVGGCNFSPGGVIAVVETTVAGQVACRVVAVVDGLCAALALQAVAAQIVIVVDAADLWFAALAAGQAVELVVLVLLVLLGVDVVDGAGLPSGGVVAVVAAVGQLGLGVETHADDDVASSEVVEAFVLLVVAPVPAVDLAVGFVADLADDGLAVAGDGGDAVAGPLVFDALSAWAEAAYALP